MDRFMRRVRIALENTNNPNHQTSWGYNDGSGEVTDDALPMIPTLEVEELDED